MKPRLVILEGADCTGKTSLAKFITRRLGAAYFHAVGKKTLHPAMVHYHENILDNAKVCMEVGGVSVVLDRHWPSEVCYGRTLRPDMHNRIGYAPAEMFARIQSMGGLYIFCFSENAASRQNTQVSDHHYDPSDYEKVYQEYITMFNSMVDDDVVAHHYCIENDGGDLAFYCERIGL